MKTKMSMLASQAECPRVSVSTSSMLRRISVCLAVTTVMATSQLSFAQQPICLNPPPIGGAPSVGAAPVGWSVASNSPDIIAGNGLWPGGGYTVSNVSGTSTSGGSMGLFLSEPPTYVESWQTTLTGLTAGVTYQVAVEWQQATLAQNGGGSLWSGGQLRLTVDGNSTDYTSTGTVAGDTWQPAVKVFTATGPTANLVMGARLSGTANMVVADSGAACSIIVPTLPPADIPTLSEYVLGGMALLVAFWGMLRLRGRQRARSRMV